MGRFGAEPQRGGVAGGLFEGLGFRSCDLAGGPAALRPGLARARPRRRAARDGPAQSPRGSSPTSSRLEQNLLAPNGIERLREIDAVLRAAGGDRVAAREHMEHLRLEAKRKEFRGFLGKVPISVLRHRDGGGRVGGHRGGVLGANGQGGQRGELHQGPLRAQCRPDSGGLRLFESPGGSRFSPRLDAARPSDGWRSRSANRAFIVHIHSYTVLNAHARVAAVSKWGRV